MQTIGRKDKADFPEFGLHNMNVKVDTGAYTSAIHGSNIKEVIINGSTELHFQLLDEGHLKFKNKVHKTRDYRRKKIKSSTGHAEFRFIIKTLITIFDKTYPIELSLSNRSKMKNPVLLGRKFLAKRFIVNVSKTNLSAKEKY
jgi:hypothetical protein